MTCPVCQKETVAKFRPFCSARCADVDLGRWLNGVYRLPGEPVDEEEIAQIAAKEQRERPQ